jgi:hypothetical protein
VNDAADIYISPFIGAPFALAREKGAIQNSPLSFGQPLSLFYVAFPMYASPINN